MSRHRSTAPGDGATARERLRPIRFGAVADPATGWTPGPHWPADDAGHRADSGHPTAAADLTDAEYLTAAEYPSDAAYLTDAERGTVDGFHGAAPVQPYRAADSRSDRHIPAGAGLSGTAGGAGSSGTVGAGGGPAADVGAVPGAGATGEAVATGADPDVGARSDLGGWAAGDGAAGTGEGDDSAAGAHMAEATDPADDNDAVRHRPRRIRLNRLVQTWVPEPLRDARVDPGRRGALVLLLVAALAAVATAVGVWRDRPVPRPVQPVAMAPVSDAVAGTEMPAATDARGGPAAGGVTGRAGPADAGNRATGVPATGSPQRAGTGLQPSQRADTGRPPPSGTAELAVSVTGLVKRPGLVRVPSGARVADAIAAAGGVTDRADITGLNLAAVLGDGDSVVVGGAAAGGSVAGHGPTPANGVATATDPAGVPGVEKPGAPVDLNSADQAALEELPGVGPVMAENILAWRQTNGAFTSVDQLQEVTGIGPARFAQLQPLVTVGPGP